MVLQHVGEEMPQRSSIAFVALVAFGGGRGEHFYLVFRRFNSRTASGKPAVAPTFGRGSQTYFFAARRGRVGFARDGERDGHDSHGSAPSQQ